MNEAKLLSDLEAANLGVDLIFQVTYDDANLVVVINRPQPKPLDYDYLKPEILAIIEKSELSKPITIYFYSRILGEEEPDWQDEILIPIPSALVESEPQLDSVKTSLAIAAREEVKDTTPKDITEYRFGLSDYLIETTSEPPESDIAEIVIAFEQLSETNKYILLPALEQFFVNQDRNTFVGLSPELSDLTQKIEKLNKRKQRLASIWVARYCVRGEEILAIANKSHIQPIEATSQAEPETSQNISTSVVQTSNSVSTNSTVKEPRRSSVSNRVSVPQTKIATSANSNLVPMAIALMVTGILSGWLFNGAFQAAGWIALVGFTHGFIWAVRVSYGNKLFLGSTVFNVGVIIFFRGYLWSQAIGIATGLALAFAFNLSLKTFNNNGRKLFGKRGAIALGAVLMGMILSITLVGKSPTIASLNTSSSMGGNIYINDEGEISMPEVFSKGATSSLRIENRSPFNCLLIIQSTNVEKYSVGGGEATKVTGIGAATTFTQTLANQSSDLPFALSVGTYRLVCQENTIDGVNFEVVP
jgi:hypothetical protein